MLTRVADGVFVHESACIQSNTTVIEGDEGVLLVDPGLTNAEFGCLARDLRDLRLPVVAGFSTHPDWDHVLWHGSLGDVPRYATAAAAASMRAFLAQPDWRDQLAGAVPEEVADDLPLDLFGLLDGLPENTGTIPWKGPTVRILEHRAHAIGHAALLVEQRGVLVAGDLLSDVLVPMPDLRGAASPLEDYLAALDLLDGVVGAVETLVPGHGSVADSAGLRDRLRLDRVYIDALLDRRAPVDPRVGADVTPGWEWVRFIHEAALSHLGITAVR